MEWAYWSLRAPIQTRKKIKFDNTRVIGRFVLISAEPIKKEDKLLGFKGRFFDIANDTEFEGIIFRRELLNKFYKHKERVRLHAKANGLEGLEYFLKAVA